MSFSKGKRECLTVEEEEDIATVGTVVQQDHFVMALDQLQEAHSDTIGAPKVCTGTACPLFCTCQQAFNPCASSVISRVNLYYCNE